MTTVQNTPGPWRVAISAAYDDQMGEIGRTVCVVIGDKNIHITHAGVAGMPDDYLEQRANARLIAAAPEMYEVLNTTLCFRCHVPIGYPGDRNQDCPLCSKARKVIAKARGDV